MAEWFEDWFGDTYLEMYPHRDEKDADAAVTLISKTVPLRESRVLDLACGPGRHSNPLRRYRARVVGLDLSAPLLNRAQNNFSPPMSVVRGDMRMLPFSNESFDVVVNLFTSFGYFDSDEQHSAVLRDVARILKRNGWFVLDYLNAARVRDTLVGQEELHLDGKVISVSRRISDDGNYVIKDMNIVDEVRTFRERVRLFDPRELENLLSAAGFSIQEKYGSYDGDALDNDSSRAIFLSVCQ